MLEEPAAETGELRFEKVTGNGLHCEARLRYNREKQFYEPAGDARAPGLPYVSFADVDHDGLLDIFAVGPNSALLGTAHRGRRRPFLAEPRRFPFQGDHRGRDSSHQQHLPQVEGVLRRTGSAPFRELETAIRL